MEAAKYSCKRPGRSCVLSRKGAYDDIDICNRHCETNSVMRADEPSLEAMMTVFSEEALSVRFSRVKGRYVTAKKELMKGQRILTAPAAIVGGKLSYIGVLLTLPLLVQNVPGLQQLSASIMDEDAEELDFWSQLFPKAAVQLAAAVRNNALGAGSDSRPLYEVSFPFSMIEHSCNPNAFAVYGRYPVRHLEGAGSDDADLKPLSRLNITPAIAVYALRAIPAGEAVSIVYGKCEDMAKYGFACSLGSRGRPCGSSGEGEDAEQMALLKPDLRYMDGAASLLQPKIDTLESFVSAVAATTHLFRDDDNLKIRLRVRDWMATTFPRSMSWAEIKLALFH